MIKILSSTLLFCLVMTSVAAKSIDLTQAAKADCVSDEPCAVVDESAAVEDFEPEDYTKSIKPSNEKYDLETGDEWKLIHQNSNTQFFESITTISDGNQLIQAWVKSVNPKRQYTINYYQVLCKDRTFTRLEQFKSQDDKNYKLVKKVEHYRQTQPFSQAGEILPVLQKLCQD
ncbi:hypothetical protein ACG9X6_12335 [Acinetobacter guillouiae]|uniref:hypothetical protein n=1 Tax=Acinetobacter TaxID=469 RepID=UPI001FBA4DF8|nr:hypothetical protein [Acinetobacter sp. NyZ410]UOH19011.1 hypothetical protein MTO68_02145 [Acinetobacter sp. NyZ410]